MGFFDLPTEEKIKYVFPQNINPFGYTALGGEVLSLGKAAEKNIKSEQAFFSAPDLKEMFTIGPKDPKAGFPPRAIPNVP